MLGAQYEVHITLSAIDSCKLSTTPLQLNYSKVFDTINHEQHLTVMGNIAALLKTL